MPTVILPSDLASLGPPLGDLQFPICRVRIAGRKFLNRAPERLLR
jgi:hypothetical protein